MPCHTTERTLFYRACHPTGHLIPTERLSSLTERSIPTERITHPRLFLFITVDFNPHLFSLLILVG